MNRGRIMARLRITIRFFAILHAQIWWRADSLADIEPWSMSLVITYAADAFNVQFEADIKMSCFEALHEQKLNWSHLQPFGVEYWVYVRPEQQNDYKFDSRGAPRIFVDRATCENKPASVIHIS